MRIVKVSATALHESAHAVVQLAFGITPPLVWVDDKGGGKCVIGGKLSPFKHLTVLAAGYCSIPIFAPFEFESDSPVHDPISAMASDLSDDDVSPRAMATAAESMVGSGSFTVPHDHKQIDEIIEGLFAAGRIRPRRRLLDRWHGKALERAWTILERNADAVVTLAMALAERGALSGSEIKELLSTLPLGA